MIGNAEAVDKDVCSGSVVLLRDYGRNIVNFDGQRRRGKGYGRAHGSHLATFTQAARSRGLFHGPTLRSRAIGPAHEYGVTRTILRVVPAIFSQASISL